MFGTHRQAAGFPQVVAAEPQAAIEQAANPDSPSLRPPVLGFQLQRRSESAATDRSRSSGRGFCARRSPRALAGRARGRFHATPVTRNVADKIV